MARTSTTKEKAGSSKSKGKQEKSGSKSKEKLQEQLASLGGDEQDLDLLKGVRDDVQLEIGSLGNDVRVPWLCCPALF